jgi:hypothetical protein
MDRQKTLLDFEETFNNLEQTINLFDDQSFNQVPFEGSWTPGQVVQHINLSSEGFAKVLNAEVKEADRPIDQLIPKLEAIFLDFTSKMQSPDFILPESKTYDRGEHLITVKRIKQEIAKAILEQPLEKICLAFELPTIGYLTGVEAVYFVVFHTKRHINQLKEIHHMILLS